jgi:predicted SAM-dependent methyltransferase/Zn finger protein HypA/HybF involved in hydrogenase expression
MFSKVKKVFIETCPRSLLNFAVVIVHKGRMIRSKATMILRPQKAVWFCPCCGYRFQRFIVGDYSERQARFNASRYEHTRQDVLCPVCKALPRHRILASWSDKHIEQLERAEILYFAPEYSMTLWMNRNGITCTTADLYDKADLKLDIQDTGLEDNSYDVVIANHVLEHVDDFRKALREMYRILKPGGCFICSFPMDPKIELLDEEEEPLTPEKRLRRFGQNDHKRVFGMKADQFLMEVGFDVEVIDGSNYPKEILPVVGPADYDMNILFCCRKPV